MTPERLAGIKGRAAEAHRRSMAMSLFDTADIAALVLEVERCWEGLRSGAAERDRLRERVARLARIERTFDELSRLAADDTVSDAYVRGWVLGGDR